MHEFSVISSIVDLIREEIDKRDNVIIVKEVQLEVGELTFLGREALQFGFRALTESETKINSEGLKINTMPANVRCLECDYNGPMKVENSEEYHIRIPTFACPSCGGPIDITKGKECTVKNLILELEDE